jgi:chromosomal replication initiator protein
MPAQRLRGPVGQLVPLKNAIQVAFSPQHSLAAFVVGPSNQRAHATALQICTDTAPGRRRVVIIGGTGLGKTHLAHAVAQAFLARRPGARVLCGSGQELVRVFGESRTSEMLAAAVATVRSGCDLLVFDDLQWVSRCLPAQECIVELLCATAAPVLFTCDRPLNELGSISEGLRNQLRSLAETTIDPPGFDTRLGIVMAKAAATGTPLDERVAVLLAETVQGSGRDLTDALARLHDCSRRKGRPVDYDLAERELRPAADPADTVTALDIQHAACVHFGIPMEVLIGRDRHKGINCARQVALYLCRQRLGLSYPTLGRVFGGRDHTTAMNAVRRIETLRRCDGELEAHLAAVEQRLSCSADEQGTLAVAG